MEGIRLHMDPNTLVNMHDLMEKMNVRLYIGFTEMIATLVVLFILNGYGLYWLVVQHGEGEMAQRVYQRTSYETKLYHLLGQATSEWKLGC